MLVCICSIGVSWVSCSGNSEDLEQVVLSVSKNAILADGKDVIEFSVMYGGEDVTADAVIRSVTDGKTLDGSTFSTFKAGTYVFEASYSGSLSQQITVVANKALEKPETTSKFVRHICAMEFTGTWCAMCPDGMAKLNYLVDTKYKGIVYVMAFHVSSTDADPMEIKESLSLSNRFKVSGYPSCVVDMRDKTDLNISDMRTSFNQSLENYPSHCGVAISSLYNKDASKAEVTVKVTSEKVASYRLVLYAVEDGLRYQQNDGGLVRDYTHNHVVRKLLSASIDGDKLGQIAVNKEEVKKYTVDIDKAWNVENLSFYALVTDENGYVNNLAVCEAMNGNTDYEYTE